MAASVGREGGETKIRMNMNLNKEKKKFKNKISKQIPVPVLFFLPDTVRDTFLIDPAIILIVVGVVMFFITFCGCIGALRENIRLLKTVIDRHIFNTGAMFCF